MDRFAPPMPMMPMMPSMGMDPMMGGMGMGAPDPMAMLAELMPPQPIYPSWFKKPPKPDPQGVADLGKTRWEELRPWRAAVDHDLAVLRFQQSGIFEDDRAAFEARIIDDFASPLLINEFNLACAIVAGVTPRFSLPVRDERLKVASRQVADAVRWIRRMEGYYHEEGGDMPLPMAEAKVLLAYGMVAKRTTIDLDDAAFPTRIDLIDPSALVIEHEGKRGPRRVWRVFRSTVRDLALAYGDFPRSERTKFEDKLGVFDDDTEIPYVVEYWDRWWRCVVIPGGGVIVPATAHEYGETPYTIGYGPLGEPMLTHALTDIAYKDRSGDVIGMESSPEFDRRFKSVGYVRFQKEAHLIHEAIMRRMLYGVKKALWPAHIRYRSTAAAARPAPELDDAPGMSNEAMYGEEEVQAFPTSPMPIELSTILQSLSQDRLTGSLPLAMYGVNDKSNVSGSAVGSLTDAGFDKIAPWLAGLGSFHERSYGKWLRLWRNHGHLAKYAGPQVTPFMIPAARPRQGEAPAFELTRELIDLAGTRIEVRMTNVRKQDYMALVQAGRIAEEAGFVTREIVATDWLDLEDWERIAEEWDEDQAMRQARSLPEFAKAVTIPAAFLAEMEEAEGDPERQAALAMMMKMWQAVALGMAPGGAPAPGAPPGQTGQPGMNPPTAQGVSYPQLGQGPGSVTGQQGGQPPSQQGTDVGP